MIKVYILPTQVIDNTLTPAGLAYFHHCLLTYGYNTATLVQDTDAVQDAALTALAIEVRDPTPTELQAYQSIPEDLPPTADELRAAELLTQSPDVITQPEIWELLRIFGRRLGY